MKHLEAAQIDELRAELESMLDKLERSMRVTREAAASVQLDQTALGRLSRIDAIQNQELARNLQEREQAKLNEIQRALERLEDGSYGLCVVCGDAIPFGRLFVVPEAPTCAACGEG